MTEFHSMPWSFPVMPVFSASLSPLASACAMIAYAQNIMACPESTRAFSITVWMFAGKFSGLCNRRGMRPAEFPCIRERQRTPGRQCLFFRFGPHKALVFKTFILIEIRQKRAMAETIDVIPSKNTLDAKLLPEVLGRNPGVHSI